MFHQFPSLAIFDQVYVFLYLTEVVICNIKLEEKSFKKIVFRNIILARLDYKTDIGHRFSYGSVFIVL